MNAEMLHDAINDLDDALILQVDALRNSKRKKKLWPLWLPAAACLCLVLLSTVMPKEIVYRESDGTLEDFVVMAPEVVMEQDVSVTLEILVKMKITRLLPDGFVGTVLDENQVGRWNPGSSISVTYGEAQDVPILEVGDTVCVTVSEISSPDTIVAAKVEKEKS